MSEDEDTGTTSPEIEEEARSMGWVPPEEWVGDPPPNGFLEADAFVERGRNVLPIIQAQNRDLREEIKTLKSGVDSFRQFATNALERERAEKESLITQLEAKRAEAIEEGDGEAAVKAEREIHELRTEAAAPDPHVEAAVDEWLQNNGWFTTDPVMRSWADGRALAMANDNVPPGLPTLERIAAEAREAFPDRFGKTNGDKPPPSPESGRKRRAPGNQKTFADLPAEAKRAYEEFKEVMPDYTKEQYLAMYEWED